MPIELHAFDTPNGRKIRVALEEMALPYIVTIVDIRKGDQFDPEFLKFSGAYLRRAAASALTQA
jgi:GSH-dependent disulfide-bond oxidoreductase